MGRLSILCAFFLPLLIVRCESVEIFGGNEAKPHSRPYMVLLKNPGFCGGTLIRPNWVLTAAHCKMNYSTEVILGAHNWKEREKEQQRLQVLKWVPHPYFDFRKKLNDIQLVQLKSAAKINKFVNVFPLPTSDENIKKPLCSTAGWGMTSPKSEKLSNVLREANLNIVENASCQKSYEKLYIKITDDMICAGPLKKRKDDACPGDSGGPLICSNSLRGIVSFGPQCGNPKIPGVYTRLSAKYLKWIRTTIGGALEN
ncbi:granzyme A-like [Spea bombifrons]|uniref:granzyme A-like n=1 Tax=Spea bombifrons TaxID=233779 RepID=UPI00234A8406|nr:granzyme A-like [Spea bombifrons]